MCEHFGSLLEGDTPSCDILHDAEDILGIDLTVAGDVSVGLAADIAGQDRNGIVNGDGAVVVSVAGEPI